MPRFHASGSMTATRKSSETVIQWAAAEVPELVGGSADLAPSTLTLIADGGSVEAGAYDGRNLHFGIREHAMGAIVNGMTLHYLRGYGATFFTFSDYMRGSIRLAALMRLPSIFVFTHDSIGLGEDGPTHQPIEQLAGLRAMPVLRWSGPPARTRPRSRGSTRSRRRTTRPRSCCRARASRPGTRRRSPTTRSSAVRTCCATRTTSRSRRS